MSDPKPLSMAPSSNFSSYDHSFQSTLPASTYKQVASLFRNSRRDEFHKSALAEKSNYQWDRYTATDISNQFVPTTPLAGYEINNHLSGTPQQVNVMSSLMDDGVKLDQKIDMSKPYDDGDHLRSMGLKIQQRMGK